MICERDIPSHILFGSAKVTDITLKSFIPLQSMIGVADGRNGGTHFRRALSRVHSCHRLLYPKCGSLSSERLCKVRSSLIHTIFVPESASLRHKGNLALLCAFQSSLREFDLKALLSRSSRRTFPSKKRWKCSNKKENYKGRLTMGRAQSG